MHIVPVILAGGIGERFWPFSRSSMPKQLLPLINRKPMIVETLSRVGPFCQKGVRPIIVTGTAMSRPIRQAVGKIVSCDYIVEPVGKNTAPAVALAAGVVAKKYGPEAVMIILSADHAIAPNKDFVAAIRYAVTLASTRDMLIVFGIHPARPDTGYGYLRIGPALETKGSCKSYVVKKFVEKPTPQKAQRYIAAKNYLWNSGMFVWKAGIILEEFNAYMPDLHTQVIRATKDNFSRKAIGEFYRTVAKESIDYGIMEQSKRVLAVSGTFSWDDLGSWESLGRVLPQTANQTTISGKKVFVKECARTIVANKSKLTVATIGIDNAVVAVVDDAVLVIAREKLPALKTYLAEIRQTPHISRSLF